MPLSDPDMGTPGPSPTDPELESLPEPRRPWRRLTLATMVVTAGASLALTGSLLPQARYALEAGPPLEVHSPAAIDPQTLNNRWVRLREPLEPGAIEYRRPLDPDVYRLARAERDEHLWIEMRIPEGVDPAHYVPPTSFVGRLVRAGSAGLAHAELPRTVERVTGKPLSKDAWLLLDGETPHGARWVLGLVALLACFAAFNVWGTIHLCRPVRDA
jgi:hypothetical protein